MDYLPISKLNTLVFCERRFVLEALRGEDHRNVHLEEGAALHDRKERSGAGLWVYSDRLGLIGIVDQLVSEGSQKVPLELKKGWLGGHQSDAVQLCAQGLCLEEMGRGPCPHGYVYYHATRRRERVEFTLELRARVERTVRRMRDLAESGTLPPPLTNLSKCRGCSVREACQPEVR